MLESLLCHKNTIQPTSDGIYHLHAGNLATGTAAVWDSVANMSYTANQGLQVTYGSDIAKNVLWSVDANSASARIPTDSTRSILSGNFTIELKFKAPNMSIAVGCLIAQWNQALGNGGFLVALTSGRISFYYYPFSNDAPMFQTAVLNANTYYVIKIRRSGSTFELLLNGTVVATKTNITASKPAMNIDYTIGRYFDANGNLIAGSAWSYAIDYIRIWKDYR